MTPQEAVIEDQGWFMAQRVPSSSSFKFEPLTTSSTTSTWAAYTRYSLPIVSPSNFVVISGCTS